jgi:predicted NUDIX family phosphoesterase
MSTSSLDMTMTLCVPVEALARHGIGGGYTPMSDDVLGRFLAEPMEFLPRYMAEVSETHVQVIPYCMITVNLAYEGGNALFAYRRNGRGRHPGRMSIGVGGHVGPADMGDATGMEAVRAALMRKLEKEVDVVTLGGGPRLLGVVRDTSDEVGRARVGIVGALAVAGVSPRDELQWAWWGILRPDACMMYLDSFEKWSLTLLGGIYVIRKQAIMEDGAGAW